MLNEQSSWTTLFDLRQALRSTVEFSRVVSYSRRQAGWKMDFGVLRTVITRPGTAQNSRSQPNYAGFSKRVQTRTQRVRAQNRDCEAYCIPCSQTLSVRQAPPVISGRTEGGRSVLGWSAPAITRLIDRAAVENYF